jgi:hypothetical protein
MMISIDSAPWRPPTVAGAAFHNLTEQLHSGVRATFSRGHLPL